MEVKVCKKCGTLFNYIAGLPLCPACMKEIDDKFSKVKQYIYEHPGVGVQQVSEENEIPIAIIKKWVKEERLAFSEGSAIGVECERCGKMILTGRFCEACKTDVKKQFGSMISSAQAQPQKKPDHDSAKMRFLK
ncbi:MAG: flagellar protein [Velocimicrobium sp.]